MSKQGVGASLLTKNEPGSIPGRTAKQCRYGGEAQRNGLQNRKTVSSNLTTYSKFGLKVFMDAHEPVTLEEGDRYPLGPPNCMHGSSIG